MQKWIWLWMTEFGRLAFSNVTGTDDSSRNVHVPV